MRDIDLLCFDKVSQLSVGQGIIDNRRSIINVIQSARVDPRFVDYGKASQTCHSKVLFSVPVFDTRHVPS